MYKDIHSPLLGSEGRYKTHQDTTVCGENFHGREMKSPSPPPMMRIDHTNEPALVKGVDKPTKWGTLTEDSDVTPLDRVYKSLYPTRAKRIIMYRKQCTLNTWEDTLEITKEDLESFGLTTNPTDLILEIKIEDTQFIQGCGRHYELSEDIHVHKDRDVQPSPDDFDNETHPTTLHKKV